MSWYGFKPYLSVYERRARAARHVATLAKDGVAIQPVKAAGRNLAETFWAKSWCDHIGSFSDYRSRLERGRTYLRNGSVMHLQIDPGRVTAIVAGSEVYDVTIKVRPLARGTWERIRRDCRGQISSVVELLQGKLAGGVMEVVTQRDGGLFPSPAEIEMECSCADYAGLCKHLAAVMYGIGVRLDTQPDLLFRLRQVDHLQLIEQTDLAGLATQADAKHAIDSKELEDIFGIEMEPAPAIEPPPLKTRKPKAKATTAKKVRLPRSPKL